MCGCVSSEKEQLTERISNEAIESRKSEEKSERERERCKINGVAECAVSNC